MEMSLVLPSNYVELEQEEMMYLDGGFSFDVFWKNIEGMGARAGGLATIAAAVKLIFPNQWSAISKGASYVVGKVAPLIAKVGAFLGPLGWVLLTIGAVAATWYLGSNKVFY